MYHNGIKHMLSKIAVATFLVAVIVSCGVFSSVKNVKANEGKDFLVEFVYTCASSENGEMFSLSLGGTPEGFKSGEFYCQKNKIGKVEGFGDVSIIAETEDVYGEFSTLLYGVAHDPGSRIYKYHCDDASVVSIEYTPPPSPSETITVGGHHCGLLS